MQVQSTQPDLIAADIADRLLAATLESSNQVQDADIIVPMRGAVWVYVKILKQPFMKSVRGIIEKIESEARKIVPAGTRVVVSPVD